MEEKLCKDCKHFRQHFSMNERKIFRVYCGHCTFQRPRTKKPDAKVCENFVPGTVSEDAFASKEYLSKELLQYVLNLELLPEIEDGK